MGQKFPHFVGAASGAGNAAPVRLEGFYKVSKKLLNMSKMLSNIFTQHLKVLLNVSKCKILP